MKNSEVAVEWVKHMMDGLFDHKPIKGHNFYGIDNYLVSYNTPICHYENGVFKCSTKNYSVKSQRHKYYMNMALMNLKSNDPRIITESVEEISGRIYL